MGKYEKRRAFRQYRRAGIPFLVAAKLSQARSKGLAAAFVPPEGYTSEVITHCQCCGPETLRVSKSDGSKSWDLEIWSLLPR